MAPRIEPGPIPPRGPRLDPGGIPADRFFTFSLRYWQETTHFGLGEVDATWFMSLLNRLKDLCKEKLSRFKDDEQFKDSLRYHTVNWDARGVPIARSDMRWIPIAIRNNDAEFPIYQFQLSTG